MKIVTQLLILLSISLLGELIKTAVPLPIPSSIYGLVILFTLLCTGIIKVSHIKETADFLIRIMPLLIVPAGVGLMKSWNVLRPVIGKVFIITIISTLFVFAVSGTITQAIIRRRDRR